MHCDPRTFGSAHAYAVLDCPTTHRIRALCFSAIGSKVDDDVRYPRGTLGQASFTMAHIRRVEYRCALLAPNCEDCLLVLTICDGKKCCFLYLDSGEILLLKVVLSRDWFDKATIIHCRLDRDFPHTTLHLYDVLLYRQDLANKVYDLTTRIVLMYCLKVQFDADSSLGFTVQLAHWEKTTNIPCNCLIKAELANSDLKTYNSL